MYVRGREWKIKDFVNSLGDDDSEYDRGEAILSPIATQITESELEEAFQPKFFIATDVSKSRAHIIELFSKGSPPSFKTEIYMYYNICMYI